MAWQNIVIFYHRGYTTLLDSIGFSAHNEILGNLSSLGVIPGGMYMIVISMIVLNSILSNRQNKTKKNLILVVTFLYLVVGLSEHIHMANIEWMYFYMSTLGILSRKYRRPKKDEDNVYKAIKIAQKARA